MGMSRKLRIQYPGAIYHVMNRGDHTQPRHEPTHLGHMRNLTMSLTDTFTSAKNQRGALRTDALFSEVSNRLEAHRKASGQYPDSLAALGVTNPPPDLADMRKIVYQRTESGYSLSYTGLTGYHKSYVFSDERKSN
jgi:hypothetical protein